MNYTKGKWTVVQQSSSLEFCNINSETGVIATTVRKANAQLIASAPDLYEALVIAYPYTLNDDRVRPIVQKALAKAEGK